MDSSNLCLLPGGLSDPDSFNTSCRLWKLGPSVEAYSFSLGIGSNTGVRVIAFFPWAPGGSVS